ncbi:hypothetical protein MCBRY_000079 [Methylocystis bryophila]
MSVVFKDLPSCTEPTHFDASGAGEERTRWNDARAAQVDPNQTTLASVPGVSR